MMKQRSCLFGQPAWAVGNNDTRYQEIRAELIAGTTRRRTMAFSASPGRPSSLAAA
jgi:hypothetical protein